jgi:hypothetical protein
VCPAASGWRKNGQTAFALKGPSLEQAKLSQVSDFATVTVNTNTGHVPLDMCPSTCAPRVAQACLLVQTNVVAMRCDAYTQLSLLGGQHPSVTRVCAHRTQECRHVCLHAFHSAAFPACMHGEGLGSEWKCARTVLERLHPRWRRTALHAPALPAGWSRGLLICIYEAPSDVKQGLRGVARLAG